MSRDEQIDGIQAALCTVMLAVFSGSMHSLGKDHDMNEIVGALLAGAHNACATLVEATTGRGKLYTEEYRKLIDVVFCDKGPEPEKRNPATDFFKLKVPSEIN